jgi:Ca2+-binding RTX toxin-like protein
MTDGSNGGSFTYTGTANGKSDTGDVILDRSQAGDDPLDGNGLDNIIISDSSNDELNGYEGNDVLLGNGGKDELNGGSGRDWLVGGDGNDTMTGGAGNDLIDVSEGNTDTVRYESKLDGQDVITGFDNAGGAGLQDFIDLDPLFDNLGIGAGSRSALVDISTSGGNTIVKVDVDGVAGFGANDIQITILGVTSGITKGTAATDDIQLGS